MHGRPELLDRGIERFAAGCKSPRLRQFLEMPHGSAQDSYGNPVAVLRTAMGHFQKLAQTRAFAARGEPLDAAIKKLRPPMHFSRVTSFKGQANNWSDERLADALDLLLETEALCKTTAVPA